MSITKSIKSKIKQHTELRYLIAGGLSEVIEYFSFILVYSIYRHLYFANTLSFIFGVASGFVLHKLWTFPGEHRFKTREQFMGYCTLALINFFIITATVGYLVDSASVPAYISKFIAIAIAAIWSYFFANRIFFKTIKR